MAAKERGDAAAGLAPWVLPLRPPQIAAAAAGRAETDPPPHTALWCIPQAGSGAWVFQGLADRMSPAGIRVLPMELPGHNSRTREPLRTNLCCLARQLAAVIHEHHTSRAACAPRFSLLGHSMGAWLAWEVAQELHAMGTHPPPCHLFVLANRAPHLCGAQHDPDPTRLASLEEDAFWCAFERRYGVNPWLAQPANRALMWPILRADFTMVETYEHDAHRSPPLPMPITAIGAELDPRYTRDQVHAWRQHTTATCHVKWLPSVGHNFLADPPADLCDHITAVLSALHPKT